MKEQNTNLDKIGRRDGLTVPDGYFADFAKRMSAELPYRPELEEKKVAAPRSTWQRVRPYVYMAAMFAGVWCMLKMFTLMSSPDKSLSIDSHPSLATAVSNEQFVEDFVIDDISDFDIYDSMVEDSIDFENLDDSLLALDPAMLQGLDEAYLPEDEAEGHVLPQ